MCIFEHLSATMYILSGSQDIAMYSVSHKTNQYYNIVTRPFTVKRIHAQASEEGIRKIVLMWCHKNGAEAGGSLETLTKEL